MELAGKPDRLQGRAGVLVAMAAADSVKRDAQELGGKTDRKSVV